MSGGGVEGGVGVGWKEMKENGGGGGGVGGGRGWGQLNQ